MAGRDNFKGDKPHTLIEFDGNKIVELNGAQGVVRPAFYCDESGINGGQTHYGFGALIMGYQRRGEFAAQMREIRGGHTDEIKWSKCTRTKLRLYKRLVDYFFHNGALMFHCMVVERAWVDLKFHEGSWDLARRKHFTRFLSDKVARARRANPGRDIRTSVYADRIPSAYPKAAEAVEVIGNHMINLGTFASKMNAIDKVFERDSKDYDAIQLCDLLLGAVVDSWNDRSTNDHKAELKRHIASYLGWEDLKSDTYPKERKFNIWMLTDQTEPGDQRPVKTRPVALRHPPPPRRK